MERMLKLVLILGLTMTGSLAFAGAEASDFVWSYKKPVRDMSCVQIREPSDSGYWDDNYLCSRVDYGLEWSYNDPIRGKHCVLMNEPKDPDQWHDNFLCSDLPLGIAWSFDGPIRGMGCILVREPSEESYWDDNYLCFPR